MGRWLTRCVGRGQWASLFDDDIAELGQRLQRVRFVPGAPVFAPGATSDAVWVFRSGRVEPWMREVHPRA